MASKTAAAAVKVESGKENETAQGMEQVTNGVSVMSLADHSTQGQQSGVQNTGNSFQKYLDMLECNLKEKLKQSPLHPNSLEEEIEQLKQLVEKYVVVVKYLNIEENMSTNMPQSLPPYALTKVDYTLEAHINYVSKYCGKKKVLFLGINPSKRGMELGGVPFCDDRCFSNWLGISKNLEQSTQPNLNANVDEFDKAEGDSIGKRFWGLVRDVCGTPEVFFQNCFVRNYCPFPVLDGDGKYVSLSDMKVVDRQFEPYCNQALRECVQALGVGIVVAVGDYVTKRATQALDGSAVVQILHPSRHNSKWEDDEDWKQQAKDALGEGILKIMNPSYTTAKNAPVK